MQGIWKRALKCERLSLEGGATVCEGAVAHTKSAVVCRCIWYLPGTAAFLTGCGQTWGLSTPTVPPWWMHTGTLPVSSSVGAVFLTSSLSCARTLISVSFFSYLS